MRDIIWRPVAINVDTALEHGHFTNRLTGPDMAHEFAASIAHGFECTERS